jgi:hypothetical protein
MNVDTFFEKYPSTILQMSMVKNSKVVDFVLSNNEVIPQDIIPNKMTVDHLDTKDNHYIMRLFAENDTFEAACDFIEYLFQFNEDLRKKKSLFEEKQNELEKLFNYHSYDELTKLKIEIPQEKEDEQKSDKEAKDNSSVDFYADVKNKANGNTFDKSKLQ